MKIEGKLYSKGESKQVSASFKKRDFVVEYAENPLYTEYIKFEVSNDRCNLIDTFEMNDWLEVEFDLRGRRWTNPEGEEIIFNSLHAWRIKKGIQPATQPQNEDQSSGNYQMQNIVSEEEDIPF